VPSDDNKALVERLAGLFVSHHEIAKTWLKPPIDVGTLRKYYRDELDHGPARVANSLKARILRTAENGSLRAMTYLADRLVPEFVAIRKAEAMIPAALQVPQGTTIIIKGGLPSDDIEFPALKATNGSGASPSPANGADQTEE
jgi:hypothetical protein